MNADPEYRPFQFTIADLLGLMVIVAVLGSFSRLPVSVFHVVPLLAVLYLAKPRIQYLRVRPWTAFVLYFLVLAALLPYFYYRVTDGWDKSLASPLKNWILGSIMVFTVPTVSFFYDTITRKRPSQRFYALRSLAEMVILIPLWAFLWGWFVALALI